MRIRGRFDKLWMSAIPIVYVALFELYSGWAARDSWRQVGRPPIEERVAMALLVIAVGTATVAFVAYRTRNAGMNEVYGTTAVDAATSHADSDRGARPSTRLVSDRELAAMATTAFEPPNDVAPWQGQVLLRERIDHRTAESFLAELVLNGAVDIDDNTPNVRWLVPGPRFDDAAAGAQRWLNKLLGDERRADLERFDVDFSKATAELGVALQHEIESKHWWRHKHGPKRESTQRFGAKFSSVLNVVFWTYMSVMGMFAWLFFLTFVVFVLLNPLLLAVGTFAFSPVVALVTRSLDSTERTAEGSAMTLQVESFRRFLEQSETKYVEHGWSRRTIREHAAWAIAIADAKAVVPELARAGVVRFTDARNVVRAFELAAEDAQTLNPKSRRR